MSPKFSVKWVNSVFKKEEKPWTNECSMFNAILFTKCWIKFIYLNNCFIILISNTSCMTEFKLLSWNKWIFIVRALRKGLWQYLNTQSLIHKQVLDWKLILKSKGLYISQHFDRKICQNESNNKKCELVFSLDLFFLFYFISIGINFVPFHNSIGPWPVEV